MVRVITKTDEHNAPVSPSEADLSGESPTASSPTLSKSEPFKPDWRFFLSFGALAVITLMAALDATSIAVALPVREPTSSRLGHD